MNAAAAFEFEAGAAAAGGVEALRGGLGGLDWVRFVQLCGGERAGTVAAEPGEGEFMEPDLGLGLGVEVAEVVVGGLDERLVVGVEAVEAGEHAVADGVAGDGLLAGGGARAGGGLNVGEVG